MDGARKRSDVSDRPSISLTACLVETEYSVIICDVHVFQGTFSHLHVFQDTQAIKGRVCQLVGVAGRSGGDIKHCPKGQLTPGIQEGTWDGR